MEEAIRANRVGHVPGDKPVCAYAPEPHHRPAGLPARAPRSARLVAALVVSLSAHAALAALVWTAPSPDPQPGLVETIILYAGEETLAPAGEILVTLDAPAPPDRLAAELNPPEARQPQFEQPVRQQVAALAALPALPDSPQPPARARPSPPEPQRKAGVNKEARAEKTRTQGRAAAESRGAQTAALAPPHYLTAVLARLQQAKRFPEQARARGEEGRAIVRLSIQRNGALAQASVTRSSGSALLDQAALETVRRAAPFPPLPPEIAGAALVLNAPMNFTIE